MEIWWEDPIGKVLERSAPRDYMWNFSLRAGGNTMGVNEKSSTSSRVKEGEEVE